MEIVLNCRRCWPSSVNTLTFRRDVDTLTQMPIAATGELNVPYVENCFALPYAVGNDSE